jgi:hypothetical protein
MYISAETIAAWPTPNYTHPQTRGSSVIAIHSVLYAIVLGVVSLRIFTRVYISQSFGYDDTFVLIATASPTRFPTVCLLTPKLGPDNSLRDCLARS